MYPPPRHRATERAPNIGRVETEQDGDDCFLRPGFSPRPGFITHRGKTSLPSGASPRSTQKSS